MSRRNAQLPSKWLIVGAMAVFLGVAFIAIYINSFVFGYGLHLDETISHYVGLELWSAVFFTLGNIFVSIFMAMYLWRMGRVWKMPKLFYWVIVLLVVTLIGLSVFPSGIYNDGSGKTSIVTWAHMIMSRAMFTAMMLVAAMIVMCRRANKIAHIANVIFLIYAVTCIGGFMTGAEWFTGHVMIFETAYLAAFMVVLAMCDEKKETLEDLARG